MKPHKHAELIKAWADGAEIQYKFLMSENKWSNWLALDDGKWTESTCVEYRIKPEPKFIFKYFVLESNPILGLRFNQCEITDCTPNAQYMKVTFDYDTQKIINMEIAE